MIRRLIVLNVKEANEELPYAVGSLVRAGTSPAVWCLLTSKRNPSQPPSMPCPALEDMPGWFLIWCHPPFFATTPVCCTWLSLNSCLFLFEESLGFLFLACCSHLFALIPERPLVDSAAVMSWRLLCTGPRLRQQCPFGATSEPCQHSQSARTTSCSEMLWAVVPGLLHTRGACVCQRLLLLPEEQSPSRAALERAVSLLEDMSLAELFIRQRQGMDGLSGCFKRVMGLRPEPGSLRLWEL